MDKAEKLFLKIAAVSDAERKAIEQRNRGIALKKTQERQWRQEKVNKKVDARKAKAEAYKQSPKGKAEAGVKKVDKAIKGGIEKTKSTAKRLTGFAKRNPYAAGAAGAIGLGTAVLSASAGGSQKSAQVYAKLMAAGKKGLSKVKSIAAKGKEKGKSVAEDAKEIYSTAASEAKKNPKTTAALAAGGVGAAAGGYFVGRKATGDK